MLLNLGPGDGPYVRGFTPAHEVVDKVGTHWSGYAASVALPLTAEGGSLGLSYRYARVLPETAQVDVRLDGQAVDHFSCRGGLFEERRVIVAAPGPTPLEIGFRVDSYDRKNLGLKLDWIRIEAPAGSRLRLQGFSRFRVAALVILVFAALRFGGWSSWGAMLLAAPWALAGAWLLRRDPWLAHRLLTGVPETLTLLALAGLGLGRWLRARGRLGAPDLRRLSALVVTAFLLRALATNHPDFYYPDLMTHAKMIEVLRSAGLDFLRAPAAHLDRQGAWTKPAFGGVSILPYAVGFHALFLLGPNDYDALLTAEKLAGAALSTVPLVLLWGIAGRLGVSTLGALLMLLIPTYTSRLSFALLPALFGHAWDMLLVFWLAARLRAEPTLRAWWPGALLVACCQLAYVSSINNVGLLLALLAVLVVWHAEERRWWRGLLIACILLLGSALSVTLYYRDFLGPALRLAPQALGGGAGAASRYPIESWWLLTYTRSRDFFGALYPILTLGGLILLWRRPGRPLLAAWLLAYLLLLLLRAKVPDVFRYGHETLFVTPLVCLASGEALAWLDRCGRAGRLLAAAVLLLLAVTGLTAQWRFVADQTANAL